MRPLIRFPLIRFPLIRFPLIRFIAPLLLSVSLPLFAGDLIQTYELAVKNDPSFQAARATMLANEQLIAQARAAILPNLTLTSASTRAWNDPHNKPNFFNTNQAYGLSVTDTLFNAAAWSAIKGVKNTVKAAEATYNAAAQDLMLRTATAYFAVLQANDTLRFSLAEQRALLSQLEQTRDRYKVGLIAITDVQQTRAQYDAVTAQVITNRNAIANRLEELREITGNFDNQLASLQTSLPLIRPTPIDINQWVTTAVRQNYALRSAEYTSLAADDNIHVQSQNGWPVLSANGSYQYTHDSNASDNGLTHAQIANAGLALKFPVYQGGAISANTRKASYEAAASAANAQLTYRATVANTRKAYLGVLSGIAIINADKQSVLSSESALKATRDAYTVGTQTMFDVLSAQSNLYQQQQTLTNNQYAYLISTLTLKQAAGTLNPNDLAVINSWLSQRHSFDEYDTRKKTPEYDVKYLPRTQTPAEEETEKTPQPTPETTKNSPKPKNSKINTTQKILPIPNSSITNSPITNSIAPTVPVSTLNSHQEG